LQSLIVGELNIRESVFNKNRQLIDELLECSRSGDRKYRRSVQQLIVGLCVGDQLASVALSSAIETHIGRALRTHRHNAQLLAIDVNLELALLRSTLDIRNDGIWEMRARCLFAVLTSSVNASTSIATDCVTLQCMQMIESILLKTTASTIGDDRRGKEEGTYGSTAVHFLDVNFGYWLDAHYDFAEWKRLSIVGDNVERCAFRWMCKTRKSKCFYILKTDIM
jgi:hypothetical protein